MQQTLSTNFNEKLGIKVVIFLLMSVLFYFNTLKVLPFEPAANKGSIITGIRRAILWLTKLSV